MISFDLLLLTMLKVYGKLSPFFLLSFGTMTSGHTHGKRAGSKYGIMTPARCPYTLEVLLGTLGSDYFVFRGYFVTS